ncbi:MAG: beta-ketoacyl-ACP synthase III [Desulfovibrionaceae bacterium]
MSICYVHAIDIALPKKIVKNSDLESIMDTTDEWIYTRTGIKQRYIISEGESNTSLSIIAAKKAIVRSGISIDDITHVIGATCSPTHYSPSLASEVAYGLGIHNASAFDCNAMCSGFMYALEIARGFIAASPNAKVLLLASEVMSRKCNMQDRNTAVLFGDAATATILSSYSEKSIAILHDVLTKAEGKWGSCLTIGGGTEEELSVGKTISDDFFLQMNGSEVFKSAVRIMPRVCEELLEKNGYSIKDIDVFVPHQANSRIIEAVGTRLGIDREHVFVNVENYGNTSAASIPLALFDALEQKRIKKGDRTLMVAFGGGFTWGASILQF